MITNDTMRGLFFVIRGRHVNKKGAEYTNRVTGEVGHLGGYDPNDDTNDRWYQVLDRKCYHSIYSGSDLNRALDTIRRCIVRHKGVAKNYFKEVCKVTSEDYYEVHYLGHEPLTPEKRAKKCEGRCPRTSPIMQDLYRNIDMMFGWYMSDEVEDMENRAYEELKDQTPVNRSRKIVSKAKKNLGLTQQEETSAETPKKVSLKRPPKQDETPTPIIRKPRAGRVKLLRV